MQRIIILAAILVSISFNLSAQNFEPADYVNPMIGTDDMGHTFPGASVPFGMVQLSPETDTVLFTYGKGYNSEVYKYCAGYRYRDSTIVGFSHTHFSGTGHSDLGDFLIMPTVGKLRLNPGTREKPEDGYRSRFHHENETAKPGYYKVKLEDYGIVAELTASERVGFHKYTFPKNEDSHIILDLTSGIYNYDGKVIWSSIRLENDTLITGTRQTNGWAKDRKIYFAMAISKPVKKYGFSDEEKMTYVGFWRRWNEGENFPERAGKKIKAHFDFKTNEGEQILIKFAISGVSTKGAIENLNSEIPGWNFDKTKQQARTKWNNELSKIIIDADEDRKINFYTSMYHACLSPTIYSDVNGDYRGLDQNIYNSKTFTNYSTFSLWDTYRALHPLFTIIQQKRTNDIVNSMIAHYEQSAHKILPIWSHQANENWCMIGYHAVPVIADAYLKGIRGYDIQKAYEAVRSSADYDPYDGIGFYKKLGYVPEDKSSNSASKTLEYAYDDFSIYKFSKEIGNEKNTQTFLQRANSYKNVFNSTVGFMQAKKADGSWLGNFDPISTHGQGFIEGNSWNYSLYVPHDPAGFINLLGGDEKLINWIDSLFTMEVDEESYANTEDISKSGIIGNYVHGNEPSHHVPYLYNYAGTPWKTQERIHQIVNTLYKPKPDGLCGNDDCGQMSAWYIFSLIGFYPVAPGTNEYVIGSPCVNSAEIELENGKKFTITAENLSKQNIYICKILLNNEPLERSFILHSEIMAGGKLKFIMSDKPNKDWAADENHRPYSLSREK